MQFYSLESPKLLVENAFNYARKRGTIKRTRVSNVQHRKEKVASKMDLFHQYLDKQLENMIKSVPRFDELHPFYQELLPETVELGKIKQSVSQLVSVKKLLKKQLFQAKRLLHSPATDAIAQMHASSAKYFGRCASLIKSLDKSIQTLQMANRLMREVPDVRTDIPTLILAGFPNTGKTTMLKRMTGSKAQIAAYPFTTKSLQLGYFTMRYREVQVMDTPGLLDRADEIRNPIEKKAMAALKHLATCIVFVVDPTPAAGYTLYQQHALLQNLKKQFSVPVVMVLNKCDLATPEQIDAAQNEFGVDAIQEGEGIESKLKDHVWRALGFGH